MVNHDSFPLSRQTGEGDSVIIIYCHIWGRGYSTFPSFIHILYNQCVAYFDGGIAIKNKPVHHRVSKPIRQRAKELRQQQTRAERDLWAVLRAKGLNGFKFRRQHPLGVYIADFYCAKARLIVELDGAVHLVPEQQAQDKQRDTWMQRNGYHVLRFKNDVVSNNLEQVKEQILEKLRELIE